MNIKYRFDNRIFLFSTIASISIILGVVILNSSDDSLDNSFRLVKPSFGQLSGINFLEEEAGIAAYIKLEPNINLDDAKDAFRTIDTETSEYITGSIAIPDYKIDEDVRGFVHKDGWVVTYYPRGTPVTKIVDWLRLDSTKLSEALISVTNAIGAPQRTPSYYHFGYPNANAILIAVDIGGNEQMSITIPSDVLVYERSWGAGESGSSGTYVYGFLTFGQLPPDKTNIIKEVRQSASGSLYINDIKIERAVITHYAGDYPEGFAIALVYQE